MYVSLLGPQRPGHKKFVQRQSKLDNKILGHHGLINSQALLMFDPSEFTYLGILPYMIAIIKVLSNYHSLEWFQVSLSHCFTKWDFSR